MAMFIVKPWYGKNPLDEYFDPDTHIATEENFIRFLQAGIYTEDVIGYKVRLQNQSTEYDNGLWIIADVNHDSANTGQTDCYDLISEQCFHPTTFSDSKSDNWRNSNIRSWLITQYVSMFDGGIENHIMNLKYNSRGVWYTNDNIIIPSYKELNGTSSYQDNEGVPYPIFADNNARIKYGFDTGDAQIWYTRSRSTAYLGDTVWRVVKAGSFDTNYVWYAMRIAPIIRVH